MTASDTSPADRDQDFLTGKLLIAMPNMGDPRFDRAVLLICAHDLEHAMGVIINKPVKEIELGELLEQQSCVSCLFGLFCWVGGVLLRCAYLEVRTRAPHRDTHVAGKLARVMVFIIAFATVVPCGIVCHADLAKDSRLVLLADKTQGRGDNTAVDVFRSVRCIYTKG